MKFIASGASPDASCLSLLALISAAGASPDAFFLYFFIFIII